ncbi:hypothetical protein B0T10DRAFT_575051 [Thelonectria olida]|uniref:NmrA-like domain-containing protein n=1 Tax=Thelonectria olida TaxID=1576542 RepID=A0A9P8W328_9HYPO|nr:hypothetical protein B0T10DRAFT_575051 [Thelonectria olida]
MSPFKNVTLAGKGNLGSFVLQALVDAGFNVTVLGRSEKSKEDLPSGVNFVVVDYDSADSLEAAFRGQDAVISTINSEVTQSQKFMIDAAIKAGVKRFVPSDFGSLTTDPAAAHLPHHIPIGEIQKYLKAKAEAGLIEYTIFSVGAFTEFLLKYPLAFNWANKTAEIWGDGNTRLSSTSLGGIGKAIAGALNNPDATKNRNIFVHELIVSQSQLLALAKKYSPGVEWQVTTIEDTEAEFEKLLQAVKEKPDYPTLIALVKASVVSGKFKSYYDHVDNDVVGLSILSEEDLDAKFAATFKA